LLAVIDHDLAVVMASDSCERVVGIAASQLIGGGIAAVLDAPSVRAIREALAAGLVEPIAVTTPAGPCDATLHRASGLVIIELEPAGEADDRALARTLQRLQTFGSVGELAGIVATEIRDATGFDRVTVYRFCAGIVETLADARDPQAPARARPGRFHELAVAERSRYMADFGATPSAIQPAQELDLSHATLRMTAGNLAGAALALAIEVRGTVWGVIACERDTALVVPARTRFAVELVARSFAWQLELRDRLSEDARATSIAKDEFLATVSHELRTPLNAMLGWLRLLDSGQVTLDHQPQAVATITRNAHVLAELVDELLDVSRIISGKMRLDLTTVEPASVIEAALAIVQPAAAAKQITISSKVDPGAGPVLADPNRLQQIAWNLMTNAVKFTPEGGRIEVRLERVDSAVQLTVTDHGIGIAPEFLPHVFERFRQDPTALGRSTKGLGLGLAIVRHLADLHGGQVTAASDGLGHGAQFVVRLPIAAARAASPSAPTAASPPHFEPAPQLGGLRVLAVDDEEDANDLMRAVLAASGVEVTIARSAAEVIGLLPQLRPDVLISDIGMPEVDGYDLIQRVRQLAPSEGGRVPAVAVTAFARSQDRARAFLAGFDVYLAKPLDPMELTALLVNLTGRRSGSIPRIEPSRQVKHDLDGARILVVDDDDDSGELLATILRKHGATVTIARNAAEATAAVAQFRPDVLLSDIVLPDKDGYTFIRELRALGSDEGGWIPAIAISGRVAPDDVKQAILAGFQLHLAKPIDPKDLVARLARLVARTPRRT
jgi:signal transduction histidine kinase/DNA-binding response OmpR family regulator